MKLCVHSAHYDHLGIRPDMPGDNIYNGARDNATGCGVLLELARVYAQAQSKPRRSVFSPQSQRKSRACWDRNILENTRPFPRERFPSI